MNANEIESLQQELAECQLAHEVGARAIEENAQLLKQLAEVQAREVYYRSALEMFLMPMPDKNTIVIDLLLAITESAMEALRLPSDDTALQEVIKRAKKEAYKMGQENMRERAALLVNGYMVPYLINGRTLWANKEIMSIPLEGEY